MTEHLRIYGGKWGPYKQWRDEHGLLWNGNVCGVCNRARSRVNWKNRKEKLNGQSDKQ